MAGQRVQLEVGGTPSVCALGVSNIQAVTLLGVFVLSPRGSLLGCNAVLVLPKALGTRRGHQDSSFEGLMPRREDSRF